MTTTTFQLKLERGRFAQHAKASLVSLLTMARGLHTTTRPAPTPTPSAADAAAREAQAVRKMANTYAKTDPGFAADLYAAAARHEGLNGG